MTSLVTFERVFEVSGATGHEDARGHADLVEPADGRHADAPLALYRGLYLT